MTVAAYAINKTVKLKLLRGNVKGINLQLDIDEARSLLQQLPAAIDAAERWVPAQPVEAE